MGRINWGRVILGGIFAGVIINVSESELNLKVVARDYQAAMQALGRSSEMVPQQLVVWILYGFILGIMAVWLYAAIRPRFGPGAGTALKAGFVVWVLAYFLYAIGNLNMGLFPTRPIIISTIWGLVEILIATAAGAWLYREEV
jgi:hypothetical protein